MSKPWIRHEKFLDELADNEEVSTRSSPVNSRSSSTHPTFDKVEEFERRKLKVMQSNSRLFRFVVIFCLAIFVLSLAAAMFGGDEAFGSSKAKNPDMGGDFDIVLPSENSESFSTVVGNEGVKSEFRKLLTPIQVAGVKPIRSMLMFGPQGCGKTKVTKAAAGEFNMSFLAVDVGSVFSPYVGKSAINIKRAFQIARKNQPCILFLDEVDAVLKDKKEAGSGAGGQESSRTVSQFLTLMNSELDDESSQVYIVAATNLPETLDPTAARRLELKVHLPLPRYEVRYDYLKRSYAHLSYKDLEELADATWGLSFSDLDVVKKQVVTIIRDRFLASAINPSLFATPSKEIILEAIDKTPRTVSTADARKYRQWALVHGGNVEPEDKPQHRPRAPGAIVLSPDEQNMADMIEYAGRHTPRIQDVFGLDNVVRELTSLIRQIVKPNGRGRSALLYGPSGTGKTTLANALARYGSELDPKGRPWSILKIRAESILSSHQGESERNAAAVFRVAEAHQPCIVLLDEIDGLFGEGNQDMQRRGGNPSARAIRAIFLNAMTDLLNSSSKILLIGTTNHPEGFDDGLRGRFVKRLYVPLPNEQARKSLFRSLLNSPSYGFSDKDLTDLAKATIGWAGTDIVRVVDDCRTYMGELINSGDTTIKSDHHIRPDVLAMAVRNHTPIADYAAIKRLHQWQFGAVLDVEEPAVLKKVYHFYERWGMKMGQQ